MTRKFPWDLREVPWSDQTEFTRGTWEGLPLLSWGLERVADGDERKLATRRQLRAMGLRPGGQDPVAVLYFRYRPASKVVFANLYLIAKALPVRPMTPARQAALDKAMAARRFCEECRRDVGYCVPVDTHICWECETAENEIEEVAA